MKVWWKLNTDVVTVIGMESDNLGSNKIAFNFSWVEHFWVLTRSRGGQGKGRLSDIEKTFF